MKTMNDLISSVLNLFLIYFHLSNQTKQSVRKNKLEIEKQIRKNKWVIAYKKRMRRTGNRSCWVSESLLRSAGHGFWETKMPFLTGNCVLFCLSNF